MVQSEIINIMGKTIFIVGLSLLFLDYLNGQDPQSDSDKVANLIVNGDFENFVTMGEQKLYKSKSWECHHHAASHWAGIIEIDSSVTRDRNSRYFIKFTSNPYRILSFQVVVPSSRVKLC